MPAAQWGYPHVPGSADSFRYPADFITEAVDQTRGWFYSLLAVNVLVHRQAAVPHRALARPHRRRRRPQDVEEPRQRHRPVDGPRHPRRRPAALVDVPPGLAVDVDPHQPRGHRRVDRRRADDAVEHVELLLHLRRRSTASIRPTRPSPRRPTAAPLDRWARSRLHATVAEVTAALEDYQPLRGRDRHRRLGRRPVQLVRPAQPATVLAHRPRRRSRPTRWPPRRPSTRPW